MSKRPRRQRAAGCGKRVSVDLTRAVQIAVYAEMDALNDAEYGATCQEYGPDRVHAARDIALEYRHDEYADQALPMSMVAIRGLTFPAVRRLATGDTRLDWYNAAWTLNWRRFRWKFPLVEYEVTANASVLEFMRSVPKFWNRPEFEEMYKVLDCKRSRDLLLECRRRIQEEVR